MSLYSLNLQDDLTFKILHALDQIMDGYEITKKETSLVVSRDGVPEPVRAYLVSKKIEGLSDKTLETYLRNLRLFFGAVRKSLDQITTNDIRVYLFTYQSNRHCSNRSLDKYRSYLAGFFTWLTNEGYITNNPMRTISTIKYERKPRQNLTQLELEYLRSSCETVREKAIIEFLYSTGCRVSELTHIKKEDVDWNTKRVHLFGKGQKHRTSFLNAKSEVALAAYLKSREDDSEFLFVSERKPHQQLSKEAVEKVVRKLAAKMSTVISKPITPHILRHTTATMALQSGMPIEDISKLLGHESIDTTMIYAKTSIESVQQNHLKYVI